MKRLLKICLILGFIIGVVLFGIAKIYYPTYLQKIVVFNRLKEQKDEVVFAKYSWNNGLPIFTYETIPHFLISLNGQKNVEEIKNALTKMPDSVAVLLTLEIWGARYFPLNRGHPLPKITRGIYDDIIKELFKIIKDQANIYIRFNPEMEVNAGLFPWQTYGSEYISAFQHFSAICKAEAPQVKMVWGPCGYPGALEYYPGDDVVDMASVTLKSRTEMRLNQYPKDDSIPYEIKRKLHRLRFIDKPILILGSENQNSIKREWFSGVAEQIQKETEVIYASENFQRPDKTEFIISHPKLEIGFYDPEALIIQEAAVTSEHIFADFGSIFNGTFEQQFNGVISRNHHVILTFEPFRNPDGSQDEEVLQNIVRGKYDSVIQTIYSRILQTDRDVYLRFAHEMEIPIRRYPWQSQDPVDYIKAFRYFMKFHGELPPHIKRVWGPAGDRGSLEFWPGNDVVDYVSFAIYGLPDKNITDPNKQESFNKIFNRKYWRMRFLDKPVFITEFGVKGPEEYQTAWLEDAARTINDHPQVVGINYFNMSDTPKAWGDIKPPDWRISKKSFYRFLEILERD